MRLPARMLFILATAASLGVVAADDSPERSPELEVLNRFAGTWDIRSSFTVPGIDPTVIDGVETREWSAAGGTMKFENAADSDTEFHLLVTWDPDTSRYVGVLMTGPGCGTVVADWDEANATMTFVVTFTDGSRYEGTNRFIDEDHIESKGTITNSRGDLVIEMSMDQTRR